MSLRSDKDVKTYLLKSRSDDNEKMSCYRQFIRGFNYIPAFSVQGKSRSVSVLQKNLMTIIQNISES
jgi:hypothetical protein